MTSVLIAAHNEATVLGPCLDAVLADTGHGELEIIVAANGCTDRTVDVALARPDVRVIETNRPSKTAALNSAEAVATSFPRIYLDADIPVSTATVRALARAVDSPTGPLVAVPSRRLDLRGRPLAVRAYYAIQRRLPVFEEGLFGRGMIAVSQAGRERFSRFPDVLADDLFLDSLFTSDERVLVRELTTTVATPLHTRDLVRRLVRVRRGNAALRAAGASGTGSVRAADRLSWLRDVVLPRPWLAPAAAVYVVLTAWASVLARLTPRSAAVWGRDESSRVAAVRP
jgi:glycosyltransferase involved in cell wall biosynthesis